MKYSIIIPAYNEEKYIRSCLHSVFAQDGITDLSEVIVVNNASTDATAKIIKNEYPQVRLIDEPKKGLATAYNRGAYEAFGDILIFADSDMVLPKEHLKQICYEFKRDDRLVALSGPYVYRDGGLVLEILTRSIYLLIAMPAEIVINRCLKMGASIASGNMAVRKEIFQKVGGFNEELFYGMESELASRIRKHGKIRFRYRFSAESSSRRFKNEGPLTIILKHVICTFAPLLFGKTFTRNYADIR